MHKSSDQAVKAGGNADLFAIQPNRTEVVGSPATLQEANRGIIAGQVKRQSPDIDAVLWPGPRLWVSFSKGVSHLEMPLLATDPGTAIREADLVSGVTVGACDRAAIGDGECVVCILGIVGNANAGVDTGR